MGLVYIIMHPLGKRRPMWSVLKRTRRNCLEEVAKVTSYDSAIAVIPTGLVQQERIFDLEFWEPDQTFSDSAQSRHPWSHKSASRRIPST